MLCSGLTKEIGSQNSQSKIAEVSCDDSFRRLIVVTATELFVLCVGYRGCVTIVYLSYSLLFVNQNISGDAVLHRLICSARGQLLSRSGYATDNWYKNVKQLVRVIGWLDRHESAFPKRHLDHFSHFCRAYPIQILQNVQCVCVCVCVTTGRNATAASLQCLWYGPVETMTASVRRVTKCYVDRSDLVKWLLMTWNCTVSVVATGWTWKF